MRSAAVLVACLAAAPAQADWQYTRWGMTFDEVAAAAPQPIARRDVPELSTKHSRIQGGTIYTASDIRFVAGFGFDAQDRLNRVMLSPRDLSQCADLFRMLRSIYGEPINQGPRSTAVYSAGLWRDVANGNAVRFLAIGGMNSPSSCTVDYEPILDGRDAGL